MHFLLHEIDHHIVRAAVLLCALAFLLTYVILALAKARLEQPMQQYWQLPSCAIAACRDA